MLSINEDSIIVENPIDLKELQQMYGLFKPNTIFSSILMLQDLYDLLPQTEQDQIYFYYYMTLNYFLTKVTSISDAIDNSKITDGIRGKVLSIKISALNPLSVILF